jgi:hypothetical protein
MKQQIFRSISGSLCNSTQIHDGVPIVHPLYVRNDGANLPKLRFVLYNDRIGEFGKSLISRRCCGMRGIRTTATAGKSHCIKEQIPTVSI